MTLDDLNPTNTFELKLVELLRQGVKVEAAPSDSVAEALGMMADKIIKLEARLEAMKQEIIRGAGG